MKRVFNILSVSAVVALILITCTKKEELIMQNAKLFLDAYFKTDYNAASQLCTKSLGDELLISLRDFDNMESGVKDVLMRQIKEVKTEILNVDSKSNKDTARITYKIFTPTVPAGIEKSLSMVKVGKEWKVGELGR